MCGRRSSEYWKRKDCKGAICTFSDQMVADAYIAEIDPGKSTKPQRQLYEEIITVAAGRGATTVWYEGTAKRTFEWERGSTFAIPLNAWHQHFNASGTEPCRYFALTSQPVAFELFRDPEFIYDTNYIFKDRFDPGDADFSPKRENISPNIMAVFCTRTSSRIFAKSTSCRGKSAARERATCISTCPAAPCSPTSRSSRWAATKRRTAMVRAPMFFCSTPPAIP